ncbi:MAG: SpoIIE family protein phosphatase [Bacteroidetes bacterium]|nr:SpoIIE family protein phosphatase [Bacteroidota bacterium]
MGEKDFEKIINNLKDENQELQNTVDELSILNDIATAISSTQSIEQIESLIIQKCVKHLNVEEGVVMLLTQPEEDRPFETMIRKKNSLIDSLPFRLDDQLMGHILHNKTSILVNDFEKTDLFDISAMKDSPIRSLLCVPMFVKGKMIGMISVFNKIGDEGFGETDKRLLSICATQSAQVIENARLYNEEKTLHKLKEEMDLAKDIQQKLLPKSLPQIEGYDIASINISAKDVGGDFYDFIPLPGNKLAFCLGDVSGKGVPAALIMANLMAILRTQILLTGSCGNCLTESNKFLFNSIESDKFATLFLGILDQVSGDLTYSSAGHENPIIISDKYEIAKLETEDIVLGIQPEYDYTEKTINLRIGDTLIIYSDGIIEAENANEQQFGDFRLADIISQNISLSAAKMISVIFSELDNYTLGGTQLDDKTLTIIKRG